MLKLGNPFGQGRTIRITKVAHNSLGQLTGFSKTQANDINASPFQSEVYAEGDGTVEISYNATNPSSYLQIAYDGMPSDEVHQLVHVRPAVGKGRVGKGQFLGTLEPYRANWYGTGLHHAPHLHWQILSKGNLGASNPFSYIDRSVKVIATHPEILAYQNWFINGNFNWNKFPDLSLYGNTKMKIGDRVEFSAVSNLRGGSGISFSVVGTAAKGAVGTIIDGPRTADGYTWFDIQFLNSTGWVANVSNTRLMLTVKAVSNVDGSYPAPPVNPCQTYIDQTNNLTTQLTQLNGRVSSLEVLLNNADSNIKSLEKQVANYKNLEDGYIKTIKDMEKDIKGLREEMQRKDEEILALKDKVGVDLGKIELRDLLREVVIRAGQWLRIGSN